MRCSNCGGETTILLRGKNPLFIFADQLAVDESTGETVENLGKTPLKVYLCRACNHIELFSVARDSPSGPHIQS